MFYTNHMNLWINTLKTIVNAFCITSYFMIRYIIFSATFTYLSIILNMALISSILSSIGVETIMLPSQGEVRHLRIHWFETGGKLIHMIHFKLIHNLSYWSADAEFLVLIWKEIHTKSNGTNNSIPIFCRSRKSLYDDRITIEVCLLALSVYRHVLLRVTPYWRNILEKI